MFDEVFNNVTQQGRFLEAKKQYDTAKAIIVGAPMDFTVSFRPGTRQGPKKIREVSYGGIRVFEGQYLYEQSRSKNSFY